MIYLLYTIHVLVCLFLILVVLLQQGKGADLSVFGGGATQAAFGARGAVSILHKLTVWGFVAFIVTTVTIGFMTSSSKSSSVLSNVPTAAEEAGATEEAATLPATAEAEAEAEAAMPEGQESAGEAGEAEGAIDDGIVDEATDTDDGGASEAGEAGDGEQPVS